MDKTPASQQHARLSWTAQAVAFVIAGMALMVAGPLASSMYLVTIGGALLLVVVIEAATTMVRIPHVEIQVRPDRIEEGRESHVEVTMDNIRPNHQVYVPLGVGLHLRSGSMNLWHPLHKEHHHMHDFHVVGKVRGPHRVGPVRIRNWSPMRLWAHDHFIGRPQEVDVVPRQDDIKGLGLMSRIVRPMQGRFNVNRPGQGFDFFSLRGYQGSDTMRSVNWKATARRDDLIVNQRQLETHSEIVIFIDARVTMGVGPVGRTPLDRGCRVALAAFAEALSSRDVVRFFAYGDGITEMPPGSRDRLMKMETLLSRLPAAGTTGIVDAWEVAKREVKGTGPILLITSLEADAGLPDVVSNMTGRGHPVTVIGPVPADVQWNSPEASARRKRRQLMAEQLRNKGAVVVDLEADRPVIAEKPMIKGAFA